MTPMRSTSNASLKAITSAKDITSAPVIGTQVAGRQSDLKEKRADLLLELSQEIEEIEMSNSNVEQNKSISSGNRWCREDIEGAGRVDDDEQNESIRSGDRGGKEELEEADEVVRDKTPEAMGLMRERFLVGPRVIPSRGSNLSDYAEHYYLFICDGMFRWPDEEGWDCGQSSSVLPAKRRAKGKMSDLEICLKLKRERDNKE